MAIIQNEPRCKIQSGTYTGTGGFGSSYPNKLSFAFKPKVVIVTLKSGEKITAPLIMTGDSGIVGLHFGSTLYTMRYSVSNNSISWYYEGGTGDSSTTGATANNARVAQLNNTGDVYNWVAFG